MTERKGVGKVLGRAAAGKLNLAVLGGAVIGAAALASWPIAALGGAAYLALVAADVSNAEFRRRVLTGRSAPARLPSPGAIRDPEVRAAVARITAARSEVDRTVKATPANVQRHVTAALRSIDELEAHLAQLAVRADELSRYLTSTDPAAARRDAEALAAKAAHTADPVARASYEAAATAGHERVAALTDIAAARERTLAHLARIESAIKALPSKLVRLRTLDDQASDALTGDVGAELERMNTDLRAFEDTLAALAEVT
jgi:hypothetical protein